MYVINLYGGPCSGKSTVAAEVFATLKQLGQKVEWSQEFVKDCVFDGNKYPFRDQIYVFAHMLKNLRQYDGKVDFVVTDAPLLMSHIFGKNESVEFHRLVDKEYNKYMNFDFLLRRGENIPFEQEGRIHNSDSAQEVQDAVETMLAHEGIDAPCYYLDEDTGDNIVRDVLAITGVAK